MVGEQHRSTQSNQRALTSLLRFLTAQPTSQLILPAYSRHSHIPALPTLGPSLPRMCFVSWIHPFKHHYSPVPPLPWAFFDTLDEMCALSYKYITQQLVHTFFVLHSEMLEDKAISLKHGLQEWAKFVKWSHFHYSQVPNTSSNFLKTNKKKNLLPEINRFT